MFGFNNNTQINEETIYKATRDTYKEYYDWIESNEGHRLYHLETLIIKTYESVNIEADKSIRRLDDSFTREDYVEDFKVFFKPEVFNKLKEWCKEYEILVQKECEILGIDK